MKENSGALFSSDKVHRYKLWRRWDKTKPNILFIGLNPSRADAVKNDHTIARCIEFVKAWGYGGMYFGNLYSFRTPYVKPPVKNLHGENWKPLIEVLPIAHDEMTDILLQSMINDSAKIVCAWGSWKFINDRVDEVGKLIAESYCFGLNNDDSPKHPLYLSKKTLLQKFYFK